MIKYIFFACLISFVFLFTGCEKEIQDTNQGGGELRPLEIVFGGIEEYGDNSSLETRNSETILQTFVQPLDSTQDTGIDIVTTVEMLPMGRTTQTKASLDNLAFFSMIVYDSTGKIIADNEYQVNQGKITLVKGTEIMLANGIYKFVCLTNNNLNSASGRPNISVKSGNDFATFCITKNITATDHSINIVFKRQMSRVQIAASVYLNGSASYSLANLQSEDNGIWAINANSTDDTKITNSVKTSIPFSDGNANFVIPTSGSKILFLKNLTFNEQNFGDKVINIPVNFVKGRNYKITVAFSKNFEVAGLKWAPGNLKYDGTDYYFTADQFEYGDYFSWNWSVPGINKGNATGVYQYNFDPCSRVSPVGTWKTPSREDFNKLIAAGHREENSPRKAIVFGGKVILVASGYIQDTGYLHDLDVFGQYWTSEYNDNRDNIAFVMQAESDDPRTTVDHWVNYGLNVRCVKK